MTKKKKPAPRKKAGRKSPDLREKINILGILEALEAHILGEKEMTSTQVSAALALLKKILPDMSAPSAKTQEEKPALSHEEALSLLE